MTIPLVALDSSALISIERKQPLGDSILAEVVRDLAAGRVRVAVPAPVIAEVWRGTPRQAQLARFLTLPGVRVEPVDLICAKRAGERLRDIQHTKRGEQRPGAVDALVAECADRLGARAILTGDPDDLAAFGTVSRIIAI